MNNIKLRSWDNDNKKMAKVVALDWGSDGSIVTCHLKYEDGSVEKKYPNKEYGDDIEFLRYAKEDINNEEMYVGDVVTSTHYPFQDDGEYNYHGEIFWDNESLCFGLQYHLVNKSKRGISDGICCNLSEFEELEKIGSIYGNPDLLNR